MGRRDPYRVDCQARCPLRLAQFVEAFAQDVFAQLKRDGYLRGLSRQDFIERLAHHYAEINAIHPAREGNGRAQRAFFGQLAKDAGWRIDWNRMDPETNIAASRAGLNGDLVPLVRMFDRLVTGPVLPPRHG